MEALCTYKALCDLIWGQTPASTSREAYEAEYRKFDPRVEGQAQDDAPEDNEDNL